LTSSIRCIDFDESKSNICDFIDECLFDAEKNIFRFSNLRRLALIGCCSIKPFMNILPLLIQYQLDELILIFDEDFVKLFQNSDGISNSNGYENAIRLFYYEESFAHDESY
jgi:hypothetical protein